MDRLFGDFFGSDVTTRTAERSEAGNGGRRYHPTYHLPVNVSETREGYNVEAPVPGFRPEDVEVTFSDGMLTINARRSEEQTRREENYMRREVAVGNYWRQIPLPGDVRTDQIKATFDNGILMVDVPCAPKPEPKRIKIQPGEHSKQLAGAGSHKRN
jgi:HSP20 family protein